MTAAECDCSGDWTNGYPRPDGTHSRYCLRFGDPKYSSRVSHPLVLRRAVTDTQLEPARTGLVATREDDD